MKSFEVEWGHYETSDARVLTEHTIILAESTADAMKDFCNNDSLYTNGKDYDYILIRYREPIKTNLFEIHYEHYSSRGVDNEVTIVKAKTYSKAIEKFNRIEGGYDDITGVGNLITDIRVLKEER